MSTPAAGQQGVMLSFMVSSVGQWACNKEGPGGEEAPED